MGVMYGVNPTWGAQTNEGRTHIATKGVVQSGLMLNLDAGVSSSYPGTGTAWTDLSGNGRNGTLTNMDGTNFNSANGGSLTFDGSNEFVQCSGSLTLTAATFIIWFKWNNVSPTAFDGLIMSRGTNVTGILFSFIGSFGYIWNGAVNTYSWESGLQSPTNTWAMFAVSVTSSAATAYLYDTGGLRTAVNTVSHTSTIMDDIKIGQDDQGERFLNGSIAQALIYNRALTATEIQQNYLATKSRYFS